MIDEDVPELLVALQKDDAVAMRPPVLVQAEAGLDGDSDMDTYGDDDYHDDYAELEDEHGERRGRRSSISSIPEYKEEETGDAAAAAAAAAASNTVYTASNCNLLKVEMDDRLAPFCALETSDLRRFVVNYLISRKVGV